MHIIKFSDYIKESSNNSQKSEKTQDLNDNDGILIIVDVQKIFNEFIPKNFEQNIVKYCEDFPITEDGGGVYQIWDSNKSENYSYIFPNTILVVEKNYGTNFDKRIKNISRKLVKKYGDIEEGKKFKLKNSDTYLVKINNNHKWFYVNEDLVNLFDKLNGKRVVVIGGAGEECLSDIFVSMKSFGIIPMYNYNYIYDASMNDQQVAKIRN